MHYVAPWTLVRFVNSSSMQAPIIRQVTVQHPLLNLNAKECMVIEYLFDLQLSSQQRSRGSQEQQQ